MNISNSISNFMILYYVILVGFINTLVAVRHPVLLVPGWGGSQLTAKYIKSPDGQLCNAMNKSFLLWINPIYFLPETLDCLVNMLKLEYNILNKTTHSPKYLKVESPGFGLTDNIKFLSKFNFSLTSYFNKIVEELTKNHNYTENVNIRGAPYDFRKAPNELKKYFSDVKTLIKKMYTDSNGMSVIIIGHSMGNLLTHEFFNQITQKWKDKYIRSFISISAPYSGSMIALQGVLSGLPPQSFFWNSLKLRKFESTLPSLYYLCPNSELWPNSTIILTKYQNYTAKDMKKIFQMSKIKNSVENFENQQKYMKIRLPPRVETHCIFGSGLKTASILDYRKKIFPDMTPEIISTDGDGTVPIHSLMVCHQWKYKQSQPVTINSFPGDNHRSILSSKSALKLIGNILSNINK